MRSNETLHLEAGALSSVLSDESFWPAPPKNIEECGLSDTVVETLICKYLHVSGTSSGRAIANAICLPFGVIDSIFNTLRTRQIVVHGGSAAFNDYYYTLTENGRHHAQALMRSCSYVGPAPVPLLDYVISVDAQAIATEPVLRGKFEEAFRDISVPPILFDSLGPAVNSGAGMFLYGAPGNGKSTLARRITTCFGQSIWLPNSIIEDGQIIKLFDVSYHQIVKSSQSTVMKSRDWDTRWVRVKRPTVVVGGELTMDALEIRHDVHANVSEAPLQLKSNCGCLLIDDFGRQRVAPAELLNRWIIPLENRHDYLTLPTGKKIHVPFEQLIIFSTNLEPSDLVDEAFLRRIPYKIEISDPDLEEFRHLFELHAAGFGIEYNADAVELLLKRHYLSQNRAFRRCHPRDLLSQIKNYCRYHDIPLEMRPEYFEKVAKSYFSLVLSK